MRASRGAAATNETDYRAEATMSPLLPDADAGTEIDVDADPLFIDSDERTTLTNPDGFNGVHDTDVWIVGARVGF